MSARHEPVPELPSALPTAAPRMRSKSGLAGALGAVSSTVLPVWAVVSAVSVASLAFTELVSVLAAGPAEAPGTVMPRS